MPAEADGDARNAPAHKPVLAASDTLVRPPMTTASLLGACSFWRLWITIFSSLAPGFGLKLVVAPFLDIIYQAPRSTQDFASFLFLFTYAFSRLAAGLIAGTPDRAPKLFSMALLAQTPLMLAISGLMFWGPQDVADQWVFVVLVTLVGIPLAFNKVFFPLIVMHIYGPANFAVASGAMFTSFLFAASIGPITAWLAVSSSGGSDAIDDDKRDTAIWVLCGSAVSGAAWVSSMTTLRSKVT